MAGKLWIVPYNLQAPETHLAVTDQAHRLDQSVLAKVTVAHKAPREWAIRTVSALCSLNACHYMPSGITVRTGILLSTVLLLFNRL